MSLDDVFQRLGNRNERRTEAEIQADVRQFILEAPFQLEEQDLSVHLEAQVGDGRRIDVEVGATVIEVKRDLRSPRIQKEAENQLAGYLEMRREQTRLRYVGVLTDGTTWHCYHVVGPEIREVTSISIEGSCVETLIVWLEGVLATTSGIAPTTLAIEQHLGAESVSYKIDRSSIASIYQRNKNDPSVVMKRTLWARLLTSALGAQFEDSDELFIEHTLLVNSAEIIAHAVLGIDPQNVNPVSLLSGEHFDLSGIFGVVEQDFFDWVVEIEEGRDFISTLSRRLSRFDWARVEQDVLKALYESIIGAETRKRLGEYYTPDWLAHAVVLEAYNQPLSQRVLDPACGSGTFLFHAIRRYLAASENAGVPVAEQIRGVTRHVIGMDLHPVAVTLARVTYLLAIGRDKLVAPDRGVIQIPVYLGDSLQWQEQSLDLWSAGNLTIRADDERELFRSELRFPDALLADAAQFDELVNEMARRAANRPAHGAPPSLSPVFRRLSVAAEHRETVTNTFRTMCRLHDEGRDHIWGYYVRNLARPMWLCRKANRVDVLIGNPPWLAYRHMTSEMQRAFKRMSEARNLWAGKEQATHQDLSALFAVRACELYLSNNGRFALIMPNTTVDREHYAGFRSGRSGDSNIGNAITFSNPWDLRRIRPHFFPRAASVVFGQRTDGRAGAMPREAEIWTGRLPSKNCGWDEARSQISREPGQLRVSEASNGSDYAPGFTQGTILSPHLAFVVEEQPAPPLGLPAGRVLIKSFRSAYERKPWKELGDLSGIVETHFLRPLYTGESLLPYRVGAPGSVILPCNSKGILSDDQIELHPGLDQWWKKAESIWLQHRSSDRLSLKEQLDYQSKLSKQLPVPNLRIVYNSSGMHLAAAKIVNHRAIVSSSLYWAPVRSESEADYLCAILNSTIITELVRPLMSYGKDERHIHKTVWKLPIPKFDPNDPVHIRLSHLGAAAERLAAGFNVDPQVHFPATRRHIRRLILAEDTGREIDEVVFELIS